jgi:ankyrin repeat protein
LRISPSVICCDRRNYVSLTRLQMEAKRRIGKKCAGIHYCASQGNLQLVETHILADQSALNAQNSRTFSSVLYKANGRVEVVKQLIEWRVDLEAKDYSGWTALHIAALSGRHAETRMLIEARADVNAKTK